MSASSRRVVITGVGVVSPIGMDVNAFWQSLREGRSGVRPIRGFDTSTLSVHFAGEIEKFDAKQFVPKPFHRSLRMMARPIQLGVAAAQRALDDAAIDKDRLDATRFGVEFGAGLIASELPELVDAARVSVNCQPNTVDLEKWGEEGINNIQPLWMLKYLPNMPACHISILHNAQGPNNTITESDVASLLALGEAYRILQRDGADLFLVGGTESKVNPLSMVRQCLFEALSTRNDAPERASRPFDRGRDGVVIGEGSTVYAVEDLAHAQKRNAKIYAEVVGFGSSFDRKQTGDGLGRAVVAALKDANITPADLDHVNAHGISTRHGDTWEANGLRKSLGEKTPPVLAVKSYTGNMGAAGGLTELTASILALRDGVTPATLNYEEPDPECPVNVLVKPRETTGSYAVKVGFTLAGQCAALVIRKWQ
jgi:3-oxoacyl-[acyl-carrier-protein] synthase II